MALIKTEKEIEILRESGRRLAVILNAVAAAVKPGIRTKELDQIAEELILAGGDVPVFKGYKAWGVKNAFPAALCTSRNNEAVHTIPSAESIVSDGDVLKLDLGLRHNGLITDAALSIMVGNVSPRHRELVQTAKEALSNAISVIKPGAHLGDIGAAIDKTVKKHGFSVAEGLGSHGVGHDIHEEPTISNVGVKGRGMMIKPGMVFAIEPIVNEGKPECVLLEDEWTIVTEDGKYSAQFEHSVVVTEEGVEILTLL